jgi:O-antigen ligase
VANVVQGQFNEVSIWDRRLAAALLFSAVIFGLLPSGFNWSDFEDSSTYVGGSIGYQLQWGSVFAVSAFLCWRYRDRAFAILRFSNPFMWILFVYCMVSTLWSPYELVTLKKAVQVGGLVAFSIAIQVDRSSWRDTFKVMLFAFTSIEIASALVAILNPSMGIDADFGYAWRGVVSGKNTLGAIGALSLLMWVALWDDQTLSPSVWRVGVFFSVLCVVMSTSSTSITMAAVGVLVYWILYKQHIGSPLWLQRLVVMLVLLVVAALHLFFILEGRLPEQSEIIGPFATLFGKSADLTGRADIWAPLYVEIEKHWVLGIGYGAFWLGPDSPSQPILDTLPWIPLQAHNGYLDVLNELGALGMLLLVGLLFWHARALYKLSSIDRGAAAGFTAILVTILLSNYSESSLFRGVVFNFLLFVLTLTRVSAMVYAPVESEFDEALTDQSNELRV